MIVWNGMDIVALVALIVICALVIIVSIFGWFGRKIGNSRKKRNDRLWEKFGDKEEEK